MDKRQIVNIIFFIRATEPRDPDLDLHQTVAKQLELVNRYGFKATFLLQYDALILDQYVQLLKDQLASNGEIGGWFEIVQPLVEKAGLKWRGREGYSWDWHSDVGFSVGYTPDERRKFIDIYMEDFKERFGYYPRSMGSWVIDAVSLAYMSDKYGIQASCNCRDQWGTDGYTLWGGYYGQGYYPSRYNMLCPAQTEENQISVPVFRMLGSDPIYQYDLGLFEDGVLNPSESQPVVTLEPVYDKCGGGGDPRWVDWYFKENFRPGLSFGYTQVGQENSFRWEEMKKGLFYQFETLNKLHNEGKVTIETLCETGIWYKNMFPKTAATTVAALTDWQEKGRKSLWYESRFFRVNFYEEDGRVWIRDIHKFDEQYKERYLSQVCDGHQMYYDNLPVIDGNRWSGGSIRAGIYPSLLSPSGKLIPINGSMSVEYLSDDRTLIQITDTDISLKIICKPTGLCFSLSAPKGSTLVLNMCDGVEKFIKAEIQDTSIIYQQNDFSYVVRFQRAEKIKKFETGIIVTADNTELILALDETIPTV
jgi:hypothetical protein